MTNSVKVQYAKEALAILQPYKERFEQELSQAFDRFGPKNPVRDAMEYALTGDAKRFRPALVSMMAQCLNSESCVLPSGLAVEYFHTASLIADDLPSMDDDDFRRGIPTTHKVYGEATALLASYALIAQGFDEIARNADFLHTDDKSEIARIAVVEAARQMGNCGLIGGQSLDLTPPKLLDVSAAEKIMQMKTVTLFDLSLSLGWLFGGGDRDRLQEVHTLAYHFGIAFQIIDDLDDQEKDRAAKHQVNYANLFGVERAVDAVQMHVEHFFSSMKALNISSEPLSQLALGLSFFSKSFGRP